MSRNRRPSKQRKDDQGSSGLKEERALNSDSSRGLPSGLPHRLFEAGNTAVSQLLSGLSGGRPLEQAVQEEMEQAFAADFGDVRIHDNANARETAGEIDAQAFTRGDDIYLADGGSSSGTVEGKRLLMHELAHVVQQRQAGERQSSAVGLPGDRFEADADRAAARAGAGRPVQTMATGAPPSVQRQPAEESLGQKALDFILEQGISYTDQGWKIGGVPIEKLPAAAKKSVTIMAKILKGDLAGAVAVVNPKDPEDEKKAWAKVRQIKEQIDSQRPEEERAREREEDRRREEEGVRKEGERFKPKPQDPTLVPKVPELKPGDGLFGGPVIDVLLDEFDLEKAQLKSKHIRRLNKLADQVMADPAAKLEIIGHTDSSGPDNFNQKLSDNRANAVRDYLIKRGVRADKIISVTGKGASEPFVEEKTDADRAQNRRVEVFYTPGVVEENKRGFGRPELRLNR